MDTSSAFLNTPAVRDAAAIKTLNEQPAISLDDETWDAFVAALDAPVEPDAAVRARYARRPSWNG